MQLEDLNILCCFMRRFAKDEGYPEAEAEALCAALTQGNFKDLTEEQAFLGWDALTCFNKKTPLSSELYEVFGILESIWQTDGWIT